MSKLKMEIKKQEQRGLDTFLTIKVSESEKDGGANTTVEITLHDVQKQVKMDQGGVLFYTKDGAPCILMIAAPFSAPSL